MLTSEHNMLQPDNNMLQPDNMLHPYWWQKTTQFNVTKTALQSSNSNIMLLLCNSIQSSVIALQPDNNNTTQSDTITIWQMHYYTWRKTMLPFHHLTPNPNVLPVLRTGKKRPRQAQKHERKRRNWKREGTFKKEDWTNVSMTESDDLKYTDITHQYILSCY